MNSLHSFIDATSIEYSRNRSTFDYYPNESRNYYSPSSRVDWSTTHPLMNGLLSIRREAERNLLQRYCLAYWLRFAQKRKRKRFLLLSLQRIVFHSIVRRYLDKWSAYAVQSRTRKRRYHEAEVLCKRNLYAFARTVLHKLTLYGEARRKEGQRIEHFENSVRPFWLMSSAWRTWKCKTIKAKRMNAAFLLEMQNNVKRVEHCFFRWQKILLQDRLVRQIQSDRLLHTTRQCFFHWILYTAYLKNLRKMKRDSLIDLVRRYFHVWEHNVARRVVLLDLEAQNEKVLLLPIFREWSFATRCNRSRYKTVVAKTGLPKLDL
ncbi:hypothetical protein ADEAN_000227900 [Angomonas deanei]|uniref:Sfi1 spindle body protein n=1 Tax=Angomonas deanei TaxID=59799 RepID=A0A7G2C4U6_9TRYP|nr:hypothetical protein ADEAN_000227900 [Angomonas deanei]